MPTLNDPQCDFLELPHKFRAFVGGYGSGKTWVGSSGLCRHVLEFPGINAGYFAPTYPQIRDIFFPTIEEVADEFGMRAKILESKKTVTLMRGGKPRGTIICRSMDDPSKIVGFKIGHALVDELDVLPAAKAQAVWRKIIARMRYNVAGLRNGVDVTTTPEGFRFVYQQWVKALRDTPSLSRLYGLVQASTYDNEMNLPDGYIESLRASYPPQLIDAYLNGKFVNLTSGAVYPNFDRRANHVAEIEQLGEALHIGMDFNVLNMTAVVSVIREDRPITVAEFTGVRDTPTMARLLAERYVQRDQPHPVTIYPDASGQNTSSKNASESDLSILRSAKFAIRADTQNPRVRDRVLSVNAQILNADGVRRWRLNVDRCPKLTEALEQQAYDANGEPDKATGFDHPVDALGYFVVNRFPVVRRTAAVAALTY